MRKSLSIVTKDASKITDGLGTYKRWFNGMKFFFTVKLLPKKK